MRIQPALHAPALAWRRRLKASFDPKTIRTPGKMLPPGKA